MWVSGVCVMQDNSNETLPEVIEYYVSNERMDTIRCHRWEADYDTGEVLSVLREWMWNYRDECYTENRYTYTFEITNQGTVEHDGRRLEEYAEERVNVLTDKRGVWNPSVERTGYKETTA